MKTPDNTQLISSAKPKFSIGELVLLGDGVCRVLGMERFYPCDFWMYTLGAKVGKRKITFHQAVSEFELRSPEKNNLIDLRRK